MSTMLERNPRPGRELRMGDVGVPYVRQTPDVQTLGDAAWFIACGVLSGVGIGGLLWLGVYALAVSP